MYLPLGTLVMIVPLPNITSISGLHLPEAHQIVLNEGHVVAKGSLCTDTIGIGDCVVWGKHMETRWKTEKEFVTVNEQNIVMKIPRATLEEQAKLQE